MTSSARVSSVGGTVRPSAFAVLRLITSSYLVVLALEGRQASPLENAVDVSCRLAMLVDLIDPIRDQTTVSDKSGVGSRPLAICVATQAR